jgi:hypothetical protein
MVVAFGEVRFSLTIWSGSCVVIPIRTIAP